MPRDPDTTPICSPEKADCIHEAIVIVEQTAFDDSRTTETNCQCLPSCSDIEYPHKYSSVELSRQELVHFPDAIKGKDRERSTFVLKKRHLRKLNWIHKRKLSYFVL